MAVLTIKRPLTGRVSDEGRVFLDSLRQGGRPIACDNPDCPLHKLAKHLKLAGKAITLTLKRLTSKRSIAQNRRYWALLTVGAESLWGDEAQAEALHEEVAYLLLKLPDCPKTGLRRRMRTPELETDEFGRYMDRVAEKLIEFGADLSDWDAYAQRLGEIPRAA